MRRAPLALALVSAALLVLRLIAARTVGFGDSEALYACYALHPQPAYLDHPGLVGLIAGAIGSGAAPAPSAVHAVTALVATLVPWLGALAARAGGASLGASAAAGLFFALAPEIAVGLFALTPDLPLAVAWLSALAAASAALRASPGSARAAVLFLAAGLSAGVATSAKVTGVTLLAAMVAALLGRPARSHARTPWPWVGLALGAVVAVPIAVYEARTGWPMLRHRLVDTQQGAGLSLRTLGVLVLGQLAYLSPIYAWLAIRAARDLFAVRARDPVAALHFAALAVPLAVLVPLCAFSPAAEPHWIAPALLVLPLHAARVAPPAGPRARLAALGLAGAMVLGAHAWVLVPALPRLLPASADLRRDITSELFGWPEATAAVREELTAEGPGAVVVGPHWVVCAQLHAALGPSVPVGCAGPRRDDFDGWLPDDRWARAEVVIFVTDSRFAADVDEAALPAHARARSRTVTVRRGGRVAREIAVRVWSRTPQAAREGAEEPSPGARR